MKDSNFWFGLGALLVLAGAVMKVLDYSTIAPFMVGVGGIVIFLLRLMNKPQTNDFRVKRLLNMQLFSSLLLVVSAFLMFTNNPPNVWALSLFLAALIETFIVFRLPKEE